jgi:hypothetical protein
MDKVFTVVMYKVGTNIKLTCINNISQMKKIFNFQKCHLLSKCLETVWKLNTGKLKSLPQFHLGSNLDKECSIVFYNPCTAIFMTCTS